MKVLKYRKLNITEIKERNKDYIFYTEFRTILYNYIIEKERLTKTDKEAIDKFNDGTHKLLLVTLDENFIQLINEKRIVKMGKAIDKFVDKEFPPIDYINYPMYHVFTQLDGITTVIGMSGAGKTYSALSMLPIYANYFDKIAYLNYELTNRDIIERFDHMYPMGHSRDNVVSKLYMKDGIMTSLNLEEILEAMDVLAHEKVVFIVDNVGSVIGQEDNIYQKQNEFLKELDTLCKERGFHALALTQMVKDHNMKVFNDAGDISDSLTMSIMSGSIMLGNLSRSVLFTAYNSETEEFKQKVLKRGTGKFYHEIDGGKIRNEYITSK